GHACRAPLSNHAGVEAFAAGHVQHAQSMGITDELHQGEALDVGAPRLLLGSLVLLGDGIVVGDHRSRSRPGPVQPCPSARKGIRTMRGSCQSLEEWSNGADRSDRSLSMRTVSRMSWAAVPEGTFHASTIRWRSWLRYGVRFLLGRIERDDARGP